MSPPVVVFVPATAWIATVGEGQLQRLGLGQLPDVQVGSTIFRLAHEGAFIQVELRHPAFTAAPDGESLRVYLTIEDAAAYLAEVAAAA